MVDVLGRCTRCTKHRPVLIVRGGSEIVPGPWESGSSARCQGAILISSFSFLGGTGGEITKPGSPIYLCIYLCVYLCTGFLSQVLGHWHIMLGGLSRMVNYGVSQQCSFQDQRGCVHL